jgi:hypothetical protein
MLMRQSLSVRAKALLPPTGLEFSPLPFSSTGFDWNPFLIFHSQASGRYIKRKQREIQLPLFALGSVQEKDHL